MWTRTRHSVRNNIPVPNVEMSSSLAPNIMLFLMLLYYHRADMILDKDADSMSERAGAGAGDTS
jgi:hypothetical protein